MSEQTALIAGFGAILALLALDARRTDGLSSALWLAVVWMALLSSRPVAQWIDPAAGAFDSDPTDGSLIDSVLLLALMAATGLVLLRRNLEWRRWIGRNKWMVGLLLFAALSVLWSDYSEVAAKRWIRGLGSVLVVLLVLSERDPAVAVAAVVRRCAIVVMPLSIILVKYFRFWGVGYNYWTGEEYIIGATTDKNALGRICVIVLLFTCWSLGARARLNLATRGWPLILSDVAVFACTLWLLSASKSSTSLACVVFGVLLLLALGLPGVRSHPQRLIGGLLFTGTVLLPLALLFGAPELIVSSLGRDLTLTGRVFIWSDLLKFETNPIVGVGYASFWLGDRLAWFARMHQVNVAHNGFLEVYLGLGIVGLLLFGGVVLHALAHIQRSLSVDPAFGQLRLMMVFVFLLYNMTETATLFTSLMFFVFLFVAIERPQTALDQTHIEEVDRVVGELERDHVATRSTG